MSKKRKARIITIAAISVFCVALLAIVLVTQLRKLGTEANTLAVENWLNEEETVVLGTCYEVSEMSAIGTDGTEYPVDVNVYRVSNGRKVPLILDSFDIIEMDGYTIEYTARSEDAKAVKKVTLNVSDQGNPVICGNILAYTEVKKRYEYPNFHIVDDSGEIDKVTVEMYRVSTGERVASDDKGFTPEEVGEYHMVVQASDASGNLSNKATFSVWGSNIRNSDNWLKLKAKKKQVRVGRTLVLSENDNAAEIFAGCTDPIIEIRSIYGLIDATKTGTFTPERAGDYTVVYSYLDSDGKPINGSYQLLAYDKDEAGTLWRTNSRKDLGAYTSSIFSWLSKYDGEKGVIRYRGTGDNVWGAIFRNVEPMFEKSYYEECDTLVFKVKTDDPDGMATLLYFAEGERYDMTLIRVTGEWTEVEISFDNTHNNPSCKGSFEDFWKKFVENDKSMMFCHERSSDNVGIYISDIKLVKKTTVVNNLYFAGVGQQVVLNDNARAVFAGYTDLFCTVLGPDGKTVKVSNGSFRADTQGKYTIIYNGFDAEDRVTRASYQIAVYPKEYRGTLWDTDSGPASMGACSTKIFSWLKEYDGEKGVIRYKGTGEIVWGEIFRGLKPVFEKSYYAGSDTLVFKVKTDDPDGMATLLYFAAGENYDLTLLRVTGEWSEVEISFANTHNNPSCAGSFEDFWKKFVEKDTSMMFCHERSSDNVGIYIADIKLVKKATVTNNLYFASVGEQTVLNDNAGAVFAGHKEVSCKAIRPDGKTVSISNGSFSADMQGKYTIVYTGFDAQDRVTRASYQVAVYPKAYRGTLWDTDNGSISMGACSTRIFSWLPEYDGEKGVIRYKGTGEIVWGEIFRGVKPVFEKSYYAGSDTLVFKVKTDDPDGMATLLYFAAGENYDLALVRVTEKWAEVEISFANTHNNPSCAGSFEDFWQKFVEKDTSMMFCHERSSDNVGIYIADIKLVKKAEVTNNLYFVGVGEKVTLDDNAGEVFAGYRDFSCQVLDPNGKAVKVSNGNFQADLQGKYTVIYTGCDAAGRLVRGSYSISVYSEMYRGTLWDTDSVAGLGSYSSGDAHWMKTYDNENGVIQLDHDKWIEIFRGVKPLFDKAYYEGCNTLIFKVKTDDPMGQKVLTYLAQGKNYEIIVPVTGEWTEVAVPLTNVHALGTCEGTFEDFWTNYIDADTSMMWVHEGTAGSHVYVADIKLVKQVKVTGTVTEGKTGEPLALTDDSSSVFAGMKNLSLSVTGPDGAQITVTDGEFTPEKAGTYTAAYKAVDAEGSIVYGSYTIKVKSEPKYAEGTLWALDSEESLGGHGSNIKWLDSYDGEKGVISVDFDDSWSINVFGGLKPVFSKEYYAGCDTLVFKVKTDDPSGAKILTYCTSGSAKYDINFNVTGEWTEVEASLKNMHGSKTCPGSFEDFWRDFIEGNASMLYVHGGASNTSHVYIADIKLVKKEAKDETLWDTNSGIAALGGYNSNAVTWLESYEGETGIIRLDHDKWIHIYRGMKPIHDKAYYAGCNTLVFKVKTDDPTGQKTLTYLAEGKNYEIIVNVTGEWTEVAVPLTNVHANRTCEGTFEDFWTNYIDADTSMMWVHDGTAGSHVYIADIKLVKQEGRNNLIQAVSIAANMAKASTGSPQKKRMAMSFDEDSKKNENLLLYVVRNLVQK